MNDDETRGWIETHLGRGSATDYAEADRTLSEVVKELKVVRSAKDARALVEELAEAVSVLHNTIDDVRKEAEHFDKVCESRYDHINALREALETLVADRKEMLRTLNLSDFGWSMRGGACAAEFDSVLQWSDGSDLG